MANYNNNDRNKGGYFNQYVNFDQFLMQHNINNWSPPRGTQSGNGFVPPSSTFQSSNGGGRSSYHGSPFYFHPQSSNSNNVFSPPPLPSQFSSSSSPSSAAIGNWTQNSNLTATASEFIPQQISTVPSNLALTATASEFIPKNYQQSGTKTASSKSSVSLATAAAVAAASFSLSSKVDSSVSPCDKSNGDRASNTESVIAEALNNTHIADDKALNSSGGAIKKVRNQNYRNDSRDRHSNGNLIIVLLSIC